MDKAFMEASLGYTFTDEVWLQQALTHPSFDQKRSTNLAYERLEYLGDAVLELAVSRELFTLFPKADEGLLTKMRAAVVSRQHLAGLCEKLGWAQHLNMSEQFAKNGGRETLSVMANTFESVIGAVMMDSNYNAARKVCLVLLADSLKQAESLISVNSKGRLLEVLQAVNNVGPSYETEALGNAESGPFRATVVWEGRTLGSGEGSSKHKAQMAAAADALEKRLWL